MLLEQINSDIKTAMKAKEADKLLTLRFLKGQVQRKYDQPTDADVVGVVKKCISDVKETTNNAAEIAILEVYIPKQLSAEELGSMVYIFVTENKLQGMAGMGITMKYFKEDFGGQYDGKVLSGIVKTALGV